MAKGGRGRGSGGRRRDEPAAGHVYVLSNPSMPGILKIGRTSRDLGQRVAELSAATGVPSPYRLEASLWVRDAAGVEAAVHELLADRRVNRRREFFRVEVPEALAAARTGAKARLRRPGRNLPVVEAAVRSARALCLALGAAAAASAASPLWGAATLAALAVLRLWGGRAVSRDLVRVGGSVPLSVQLLAWIACMALWPSAVAGALAAAASVPTLLR